MEKDVANLYKNLAEKLPEYRDTFLSLAKESESNVLAVERAYYSIISDKFEACFIKTLNTDDYNIKVQMPSEIKASEVLKTVIMMEENIQKFILDAAKSISVLLPDVSWTLNRIGKKRVDRVTKLKALLSKTKE
jgi:hypothetical protein